VSLKFKNLLAVVLQYLQGWFHQFTHRQTQLVLQVSVLWPLFFLLGWNEQQVLLVYCKNPCFVQYTC